MAAARTGPVPTAVTPKGRRKAPRRNAKVGEQIELPKTAGWGGRRKNAGRPRRDSDRSRVVHAKRPVHKGRHPVHVTLRAKAGLPSFRQDRVHRLIADVIRGQRRRRYKDDFRVVHFSIQSNHLHLIVEADSERAEVAGYRALRAGVSGLAIAVARRLNMILGRKGGVWADRYHRHDLKTPREAWYGLGYLFANYTHHGVTSYGDGIVDFHSSAPLFGGWSRPPVVFDDSELWRWPICDASTWLLRVGYAKHGPLELLPCRARA